MLIGRWVSASSVARFATPPGRGVLLAIALLAGCKDVTDAPQLSCAAPGEVKVGENTIPVAPGGYATVGNQIISVESCAPHRFLGVSRPPLAYRAANVRMNAATAAADFARMRTWKTNVVRIEISQNFWVPTAKWYDPAYPGRVDEVVAAARGAGLDVILALQTSDRGDPNYSGDIYTSNPQQEMPDVNHSVPFWRDVASRYKNDGRIVYELYSEPFWSLPDRKLNWEVWLNGGTVPARRIYEEDRSSYQAVGMQQLYDVVRSVGANNLVIIGGMHWGYYLDGVPEHRVRGYNIAYAAHPWDYPDKQPKTWDRDWAFLAKTDPVILSEIGAYDCTSDYLQKVLDKADQLNLSWLAWDWSIAEPGATGPQEGQPKSSDPTCQSVGLLADWDGTPSWSGRIVKDRLSRY